MTHRHARLSSLRTPGSGGQAHTRGRWEPAGFAGHRSRHCAGRDRRGPHQRSFTARRNRHADGSSLA